MTRPAESFYMPSYTSGTYFVDGMIVPLPKHVYGEGGSSPMTPAEMLRSMKA